MAVTVEPSAFSMVDYDAAEISALVDELAGSLGLGDHDIRIEVDETSPLGRNWLETLDPIHIHVESGALEDPKRIRRFSRLGATDVLGRHLLRAKDRFDPDFGDAPTDADLSSAHRTAWDVYTVGRLVRAGFPANRQRWLYAFRNRHGFTDAADDTFETLWLSDGLTWSRVAELSDAAAATNPGKLDRKPA
ncbi:MAG: hypothetical protein U5K30_17200 [Acidimicrobiales bacterium]|nr:hypothetical protein [Acidimicrobiales bacterium]